RYLGLPLFDSRLPSSACSGLVEKSLRTERWLAIRQFCLKDGFKTENESSLLGSYKQTLCKGWPSRERCFLVELGNSHEAIRAIKENRQRQDEAASQYWFSLELKKIVATYEPSLNFSNRRRWSIHPSARFGSYPITGSCVESKKSAAALYPVCTSQACPFQSSGTSLFSCYSEACPIIRRWEDDVFWVLIINIYSLSASIQFNYGSSFAMARPHQTVTCFGEEGMDGCLLKPLDQLKQGLMRLGNSQRMEC
ncbi:hypothetical protein Ancab_004154, partial [Ancistrocladus abbreviatus]